MKRVQSRAKDRAIQGRARRTSVKPITAAPPDVPCYDTQTRILSWHGRAVKVFRVVASNQELIFRTAHELGWPRWFDDPLTRGNCRNPKVRLHNTIRDLNRNQKRYLIHFKGDGTGMRIGWEIRKK